MRTGLIGYTGFVGSGLLRQFNFHNCYNSVNYKEMRSQAYDLLVCAGVSAKKWIANQDPEGDWRAIAQLIEVLDATRANQFVLISTIDVYPDPGGQLDEKAPIDASSNHAYGRNRRELETWALERFSDCRIVRLPGLFGLGLKKNVIFDLLNGNEIEKINAENVFQWYPLERLWSDIENVTRSGERVVNLFTEPLKTSVIAERWFQGVKLHHNVATALRYDTKTQFDSMFGGSNGYILDSDAVLQELGKYVESERSAIRARD